VQTNLDRLLFRYSLFEMERLDRTYSLQELSGREISRDDEIREKRIALLKAYQKKGTMKRSESMKTLQRIQSESQILTMSPIKVPRPKKFTHFPSISFNGDFGKPPVVENKWWAKEVTRPGEAMNVTQERLSDVKNFSGSVKHNFHHWRRRAKSRGVQFADNHVDPFVPDEALNFIQKANSWRHDQVLMVQRQGDFMAEAIFRSTLRADS